ncbi:TVP38/TMEM64 family protein [Exiguobacterium flavidum]|uniref:TVP38/TMEM64 family protein n=1 Tax=Exiguobacterium flavidum TaxID=2184695 RepID=UPI000DF80CF8|nr:VTT domain-containing protein [Exiguobacterium flavidum]
MNELIQLFEGSEGFAVLVSLIASIVVSTLALPSVFITGANLAYFGFADGLTLSIIGEALGAIVSFVLYRKGLSKWTRRHPLKNRWLIRLQKTQGFEAFSLILILRLFPFVPSGLVTLISAGSKVSLPLFAAASTVGKIPALVLEAFAVQEALKMSPVLLSLTLSLLVVFFYLSWKKSNA